MKHFNNMLKALRFLLNQPLSILRFTLSILIEKKVFEELYFIYEITDSTHYTHYQKLGLRVFYLMLFLCLIQIIFISFKP